MSNKEKPSKQGDQRPEFIVAPASPRGKRERLKSASSLLTEIGKASGAIAALLGGSSIVVGLLFQFLPGAFLWTSYRVAVSEMEVEHNVSLPEFSKRPYAQWTYEAPYEPQSSGNVLTYTVESEGFQRKSLDIIWSMYEEPGQRIQEAELNGQEGWPLPKIDFDSRPIPGIGGTGADRVNGEIFIPLPNRDGTFLVKIEFWDTDAAIRYSSKSSEKFDVERGVSSPSED